MAVTPESFRRSPRMLAALMIWSAVVAVVLLFYLMG